jgi:hypothetical protein
MKKNQILAFCLLALVCITQACSSSSEPAPSPFSKIKGKWTETKTKTVIEVTKGLPPLLTIILGGSTFTVDTIRPIRVLNFLTEKDVEVTLRQGTQEQVFKTTWKFVDNNQSIEFASLGTGAGAGVGGVTLGNGATVTKIVNPNYTTELSLTTSQTLQNQSFQVPNFGNITVDAKVGLTIDLKKE